MASRRVRIKGIANIPQRKKTDEKLPNTNEHIEEVKEEIAPKKEHDDNFGGNECLNNSEDNLKIISNETNVSEEKKCVNAQEKEALPEELKITQKQITKPISFRRTIVKPIIKPDNISRRQQYKVIDRTEEIKNNHEGETNLEITSTPAEENYAVEHSDNTQNKDILIPKTDENSNKSGSENFLKPGTDINLISIKSKIHGNKKDESDSDLEADMGTIKDVTVSKNLRYGNSSKEYVFPETITGFKRMRNSLSESAKSGSDVEYPLPPASPSKILSRSRIKAVPCLTSRRISFSVYGSASESEDEGKKNSKRIRNDSVSSVISYTGETQVKGEQVPSSPKKVTEVTTTPIQKKSRKSEQYRKFAEARREFNMKFGKGTPDRQKLTMLDLIFYNPATNPMSQKKEKKSDDADEIITKEVIPAENSVNTNSEAVTDSIENEFYDQNKSEDEDDVLAPQIKVGPNGEIVVDEKSLVVENKETKKNRETLQNSAVIDGDFDTGFNGYKRNIRSKFWSKSETLRFYKALNTIGTDFSLMAELFPGRTRKDLKIKFNKEERTNPTLIDRALTCPIEFDMTSLRLDLIREEKEKEEMLKRQAEALKDKSKEKKRYSRKRGGSVARNLDSDSLKSAKKYMKLPVKKKDPYTCVKKGIASVWETDSEDEKVKIQKSDSSPEYSDSENSFTVENDNNFEQILIPTRSGRIPRPALRLSYPESYCKTIVRKVPDCSMAHETIDFTQFEPGSLLILTSNDPSGAPVYKVFMVANQNAHPVDLSEEVLQSIANGPQHSESLMTGDNAPAAFGDTEKSVTLNAHFSQQSEEMDVSLSLSESECTNLTANISNPVNQSREFILPVNMSELHDVNLTIAHTEETDLKKVVVQDFVHEETVETVSNSAQNNNETVNSKAKGKILIKENILISGPYVEVQPVNKTETS